MPFGPTAINFGRSPAYPAPTGHFNGEAIGSPIVPVVIIKSANDGPQYVAWSGTGPQDFNNFTWDGTSENIAVGGGTVTGKWNGHVIVWDNGTWWRQNDHPTGYNDQPGNPYINGTIGGDYADYGDDTGNPQETLLRIWNHGDGTASMKSGQYAAGITHLTYMGLDGNGWETWYWDAAANNVYVKPDGSVIYVGSVGNSPWVRINGTPTIDEPTFPTSVTLYTLYGDGSTVLTGTTYYPSWSVDGGSDDASVYMAGGYVGTGSSGTVGYYFSSAGVYTFTVQCTGGAAPTSNTITVTATDGPTFIGLNGDGSTFTTGDTFYPTWYVDAGSDYANVYDQYGSYYGSGASGGVGIFLSSAGPYTFYVQSPYGTNPTSNVITVYVSDPISYPTSVNLYGDGDSTTGSYTFNWSVDGGSDYANVFLAGGSFIGSGGSGGVSFNMFSGDGDYQFYIQCTGGTEPTSNTITIHYAA